VETPTYNGSVKSFTLLAANLTSTTASPASFGTALSSGGTSLTCSVERFLIPSSIFFTPNYINRLL